jgi:RES domain-containing protein
MRLWRISTYSDLSGVGGLYASGRWHSRGSRIVYLSDHPSSTLLETLVHLEVDPEDLPDTYQLLAVDIADSLGVESIDEDQLGTGWRDNPPLTQNLGNRWLRDSKTALLRVPSAIVPRSFNWLLNPAHADSAKAHVAETVRLAFDPRLFKSR